MGEAVFRRPLFLLAVMVNSAIILQVVKIIDQYSKHINVDLFGGSVVIPFVPPGFHAEAFNCPFCNAYSNQVWNELYYYIRGAMVCNNSIKLAKCSHCLKESIWYKGLMLYPSAGNAPMPNSDLPEEIKNDYEEARSIVMHSPRGASALLRLAIQKLCKYLGESGSNINTDIANLVKKGLSTQVQQCLDIVRVIGNESVHPGQLDLNDNPEIAYQLFSLVNIIAEMMISQPKRIEELYLALPEDKRDQIAKRDGK